MKGPNLKPGKSLPIKTVGVVCSSYEHEVSMAMLGINDCVTVTEDGSKLNISKTHIVKPYRSTQILYRHVSSYTNRFL